MSLLFAESFDHLRPLDAGRVHLDGKWDIPGVAPVRLGRRGTLGLDLALTVPVNNGFFPMVARKNLPPQEGLIVACACFIGSEASSRLASNPATGELGAAALGLWLGPMITCTSGLG